MRTKIAVFVVGLSLIGKLPPLPVETAAQEPTQHIAPSPIASPRTTPIVAPSIAPSPTPIASVALASTAIDRTPAEVVSVGDGDTFQAIYTSDRSSVTVRMACIDSPESAAPQG
ncbi:thermonuclease family protein [Oculatella sp. LEGE 06141]